MNIDKEKSPALWRRLNFQFVPDECSDCPFATVSQGEELFLPDPAETMFDCALLNHKRVWGESPICAPCNWMERAKQELDAL